MVTFHVDGRPRTKGSLKVITPRGRKPVMVEDHALSGPWRKRIESAIKTQVPGVRFVGPVVVVAEFVFPRSGPSAQILPWPIVNAGINAIGDLDKLIRNLLDAMQGCKLIVDDCMVVRLETVKRWVVEDDIPGLNVRVEQV